MILGIGHLNSISATVPVLCVQKLGGGNSTIFGIFVPKIGVPQIPNLTIFDIFQMGGLVQPPTGK